MPVLPHDSTHASPSLGDYGTALWRHKAIVIVALLIGALAGVLALPRLASVPEYQVTQRVDVRATTADRLYGSQSLFGQTKSKATAGSVQTQATPLDPSLVPDITALEQVLTKPGNQFKQLEVLNGIKPSLWLGTVAKNLVAVAVPGTTQIDVSYTDPDPQLAADLVGGYVRAYADRRNDADLAITRQAMTKLRGLYNDAYSQVSSLGREAQTEASRSPSHAASQTTQAQLDAAKANLNNLANQIAQVTSAQSFQGASTDVLGQPTVTQPGRKPGRVLFITTGLLLGLLIGVAIALMLDALRPILVTPEDVEQATGLRVVGVVPITSRRADALAVRDRPLSPTAEGFHRVLASLERQGMARTNKVVAVLSGDKCEGRSTVAASLALSLGRQGKPVVLVSADLRGGGVEKLFGISRSAAGLAELLESTSTSHAEDIDDELLSRSFWSIGSGLFVLPPGQATTSPSELLASRSFHEVLASLRKDGAVVILDTPPAGWSADALLVAGAADMNILVVRSGGTGRQAAAELVEGLRAEDLTPACAVLLTKRPIAGRRWRYGRAGDARGGILQDTEIHPASARAIIGTATENGHDGGRQRSSKRLDG